MSNVDSTGEDLGNSRLDEGFLEVFHLREHKEVVVDMQFLFLVEQPEGVLNSNGHRPEAVEATEGAFDGVFDEGLTAWAEFHQNVVGAFLDAHDFGNAVANFQNLRQG